MTKFDINNNDDSISNISQHIKEDVPKTLDNATLASIKNNLTKYNLFSILRHIETIQNKNIPFIGESNTPDEEMIEISQNPSLAFATRNIDSIEFKNNKVLIATNEIGLLGPNSPLPMHLVEYIFQRKHQHGDWAWASFVNLLQQRIITAFYRSWRNAQSAISLEDGTKSRFNRYVSSLVGLAGLTSNHDDKVSYYSKLYFSGYYLPRNQSKDNFESLLNQYFNKPMSITENIGKWFVVDPQERMRLGAKNYKLGDGLILGGSVFDMQTKFRININKLNLNEFESFFRLSSNYLRISEWIKLYCGEKFDWELQLSLQQSEVPKLKLDGKNRLGLTTWLGEVNKNQNKTVLRH